MAAMLSVTAASFRGRCGRVTMGTGGTPDPTHPGKVEKTQFGWWGSGENFRRLICLRLKQLQRRVIGLFVSCRVYIISNWLPIFCLSRVDTVLFHACGTGSANLLRRLKLKQIDSHHLTRSVWLMFHGGWGPWGLGPIYPCAPVIWTPMRQQPGTAVKEKNGLCSMFRVELSNWFCHK